VFLDRQGLEIFSADGLQTLPMGHIVPNPANRRCSFFARGAKKPVRDMVERVWRLKGVFGTASGNESH
jgi:hypothetical protein